MVVVNYFVAGWTLGSLWCLVLFLDGLQTFMIGSENLAQVLCRVFSNRALSMMIYVPLYCSTAIVWFLFGLESGYGWLLFQSIIELPIGGLLVPLMVYIHTDEEDVRARWLNYKLRKSDDLETSVKSLLSEINSNPNAKETKILKVALKTVGRSADTFGHNMRKIIEENTQNI